jgi:hypothetical protein
MKFIFETFSLMSYVRVIEPIYIILNVVKYNGCLLNRSVLISIKTGFP